MRIKIGFFCSGENAALLPRLSALFEERCELVPCRFDGFPELETICARSARGIQGMLFDSEMALRYLRRHDLMPPLPSAVIVPQEAEVLRTLVRFRREAPAFDLTRVLVDAGIEGVSEDFFEIGNRPVFISQDVWRGGDPSSWEDQMLRRYQAAWGSGCFDLIMTQHTLLLPRLGALGVAARALYPTLASAARTLEGLLLEAVSRLLLLTLPVCGVVGTRGGTQALEPLGKALEQFNAEQGHCMLITRRSGLFELETSNRLLRVLTGNLHECRLMDSLKDSQPDAVCIGWGIGEDMLRARANAIRAYRESLFDHQHYSYVVDDEGTLTGPLTGQGAPIALSLSARLNGLTDVAGRSGLSLAGIKRLSGILERLGTDELTSEQLAMHLGVTRRSAARTLAQLEMGGVAELCTTGQSAGRGRPAKCYRIRF